MPEAPYDPYIPSPARGGGSPARGNPHEAPTDPRAAEIQRNIDDTTGVMRENIQKASQRGEDLDALQDKTDGLHTSAQGFRKGANRVRKHMWWKDTKMKICLIIGIIILIVVIVVPSVVASQHHHQ